MEEIRFFHSRRSSSAFAALFGLLFVVFLLVTILFIKDLASHLNLSNSLYFLAIAALPVSITVLFGLKLSRNLKNSKPICTVNSVELVYTEYGSRSTYTASVLLKKVRGIKIGQTLIDNKKTIALLLEDQTDYIRLLYLDNFLAEEDKTILIAEIEKRIAAGSSGVVR